MKILSIDTASPICSVAILEDDKLIKEISIDSGLTHSEKLMPMIQEILSKTNIKLTDINLLVCDKGPGSFTGIRIGVATVKAFSDSLSIPSIGISSLESLAYNVKKDGLICSLIDAKNSNAYFCLYKLEHSKYTLLENYSVNTIDSIISVLKKYTNQIIFVGDGSIEYKDKLQSEISNCKFFDENKLNCYSLGLAGYIKFINNIKEDILPLYISKPQAERMLEEKLNAN